MPFKVISPARLTVAVFVVLILILGGAVLTGMMTRSTLQNDCEIVHRTQVTTYDGYMAVSHYGVPAVKEVD
jgi:hypothetical protein